MVIEPGAFVLTKSIRPCLDFSTRPHTRTRFTISFKYMTHCLEGKKGKVPIMPFKLFDD